MFWPILNVACSAVVAAILTYKLTAKVHKFTPMERLGMGLIGGSMVLTIGPIMSQHPTPFEDWSGTLLRVGCVVYFSGRMLRHRHNNARAVREARRELERRGR